MGGHRWWDESAKVHTAALLTTVLATTSCGAVQEALPERTAPPVSPLPEVTASPTPTTEPASWSDMYDQVNSGVVRIAALGCGQQWSGSGFLVAEDLVATASHVAEGATSMSVRAGEQVRGAEVAGMDPRTDVALLRLDSTVSGHVFGWSPDAPRVGDDVAALGFPRGQPLAMTKGAVTALDRRIEVDGQDRFGLVQTDAAVNPGNSGGPLMTLTGQAAGVVSAGSDAPGDAYAVSPATAQEAVERWAAGDGTVADVECPADEERDSPMVPVDVVVTSDHPEAAALAETFRMHAEAINEGEYSVAFELLTPSVRDRMGSVENYASQLATSYWTSLEVVDVVAESPTQDRVELRFRTVQEAEYGHDGQTCSDWHNDYAVVLDAGFWQIDESTMISEPVDCASEVADEVPLEDETLGD